MDNKVLFTERQSFDQLWLRLLFIGMNGLFVFGVVTQVILGQQFGDKPLSNATLIIVSAIVLFITIFFFSSRLETIIKEDGIYVRFFPIHSRFLYYPWDKLKRLFVRKYSPLLEYGGWGLRGIGKNRALNVSGNNGIQLVTSEGYKMLIGTRKPGEVTEILKDLGYWKA